MELAIKKLIIDNLISAVEDVHELIKREETIDYDWYKIKYDYINKLLEIIGPKYMPNEHEIIINKIKIINSKNCSNDIKLLYICDELIQLAKKVAKEY